MSPKEPTTSATPAPAPAATATPPLNPAGCVSIKGMLPRTQLAQLLMVGVDPSGPAEARLAVSRGVGGVFIGGEATGLLTDGALTQLNADTPLRVMVAVDEEGGRVQRIDGLDGSIPSARKMVQLGMTEAQVHGLALTQGRAMGKYGVTVDFAPDADVSGQPDRTVIGDRSFSADPAVVSRYAAAFARGLRDAGVLPVIKHFPGHGESSGDSHKGAVSVPPLSALKGRDLVPFRDLIASTPPDKLGVMIGHLDVPELTEPGTPASLSPAAIDLLRKGIGYSASPFDGVVFSDDLAGMAAITDKYDLPHAVLDTLKAGSDVALFLTASRVPTVLDTLEQAVKNGELPTAQVQNSVRRVLQAKNVPLCG